MQKSLTIIMHLYAIASSSHCHLPILQATITSSLCNRWRSGPPHMIAGSCVSSQLLLPDGLLDPFRHYPHFPAKLYSSALSSHLEVVQVDWVTVHFARWQFSQSSAVVLPLWKVCITCYLSF